MQAGGGERELLKLDFLGLFSSPGPPFTHLEMGSETATCVIVSAQSVPLSNEEVRLGTIDFSSKNLRNFETSG